jgi:hypothetical protein
MYIQVDIFGEHQPVDKHGNLLKIGDEVAFSNYGTGFIAGYEVCPIVKDNSDGVDRCFKFDLLERINNVQTNLF